MKNRIYCFDDSSAAERAKTAATADGYKATGAHGGQPLNVTVLLQGHEVVQELDDLMDSYNGRVR